MSDINPNPQVDPVTPEPIYDPSKTSPKITAGALAALALIVLQAVLIEVTPEMFDWAGEFTTLVYTAVTALGFGIAAWLKNDPARTGYTEQQAASVTPTTPTRGV